MTRTIKYQAWDKKLKRMWKWEELTRLQMCDFLRDDLEWRQCTGLKDKNGKEIYEGDILRWWVESTKEYAEELLEIKWGVVGWIFKSSLFRLGRCSEANTHGYIKNCEIIGNIYENPELIK